VIGLYVEVGKYGRIVLPKQLREKYGVHEGFRLIVTEFMGRICLVPVKVENPVDEPKRFAREFMRKKLLSIRCLSS